ncbi:MAG: hypothetical protein ACOC3T_01500 [Bacteroidota bacterium]
MNTLKYIITALLFLLIIYPLRGQELTGDVIEDNMKALQGMQGNVQVRTFNVGYEGIKGTPYLFDEWLPGNILLYGEKLLTGVPIKFDAYNNDLVYLNESMMDSLVINKQNVLEFEIGRDGNWILFSKYNLTNNKHKLDIKFAESLYAGKSKLIRYHFKNLIKADYTGAYNSGVKYDELIPESQLYLIKPDNIMIKLKANHRSILKAFGEKKNEIKSFMKEQNLSGNDINELVKITKHYDSISY